MISLKNPNNTLWHFSQFLH